jgi:hypothetical protein
MQPYHTRVHVFCIPAHRRCEFDEQFNQRNEVETLKAWETNYEELCQLGKGFHYKTFDFPETRFMSVTAYQNNGVFSFICLNV